MVRRRLLMPAEPERDEGDVVLMCPSCHATSGDRIPKADPPFPEVDIRGDHALRCRNAISTQRTLYWHDSVVRVFAGLARRAGWRVQIEPHHAVDGTGKRPDLILTSPDEGRQIIVDVRTCLVSSPTNCKRAAEIPGTAADLGATEKRRNWSGPAHSAGFEVAPICVEEGGRLGEACLALIMDLSRTLSTSESDRAAFRTFALQRVHMASQRGIARIINELAPIRHGPHVIPGPTYFELAPPPPRPQTQALSALAARSTE